ncbi:Nucleoid occlusion factor SlmA [Pseudovibrio axinellae]|uniref:Nucleoid occlusion factor SlmA n=1 Tax=Pseudovibrio axinellae TaxID=989403 RepID=A0A165ZG30_9HYPH|nr:TetR/AcrR family transcriptional regulator [Pseudovibrio axinellae]KZL19858.1 Nucleoid occlusion factor SlmA [Pseudovibrio axinellae]SER38988.1 transcriptional regulator, TetR family [Pseudovibrio axinellae]
MKYTSMQDLQALASNKLKTRPTPKQARALLRVQEILVTTAQVLERHPPADLSTTLIAENAGIPVSSIYRYFPGIEDLLDELYEQATEQLNAQIMAVMNEWTPAEDWKEKLYKALSVIRVFLNEHPFYRALHLLIMARRGPQTLQEERHKPFTQFLAERWRNGLDGFSGGDADVVARISVQMALTLEDLMARQTDPENETVYFDELNKAMQQYLRLYLSQNEAVD